MITLLSPYPAALVKARRERILAISDLHIGWELSLSKKGIYVPTQTPRLLGKLTSIISEYKPDKLLILGDVKHTVATAETGEWHDVPDFFNELRRQVREILIVRGNHDGNLEPLLPEKVSLVPATGTVLGDVGFFHGHQWPSPMILACETLVMGHVHPVIALHDPAGFKITKQVWVRANCDKTLLTRALLQKHRCKIEKTPEKTLLEHYKIRPRAMQLVVMPSFNDFLGGKPLNERRSDGDFKTAMVTGPVLRSDAIDSRNAEVCLLDGTFLGSIDQLRNLA